MRTALLMSTMLWSNLVLSGAQTWDPAAYCDQYRPDLAKVETCVQDRIREMHLQQLRTLQEKAQEARMLLIEAQVRRLIPMPLWQQREEIMRMNPEIRGIVAQRLGIVVRGVNDRPLD